MKTEMKVFPSREETPRQIFVDLQEISGGKVDALLVDNTGAPIPGGLLLRLSPRGVHRFVCVQRFLGVTTEGYDQRIPEVMRLEDL